MNITLYPNRFFEWLLFSKRKAASPKLNSQTSQEERHFGYHQRLRTHLIENGPNALNDFELLELILYRALPEHSIQKTTKRLFETFEDLNLILTASPQKLSKVEGVGPAVINELMLVYAAAQRLAKTRILHKPAISSWEALLDYCRISDAYRETELFRVLYLDKQNVLISDEAQAEGSVDHVPVYPREIAKRALELNASSIILVHNHPSGDPNPSEADIYMTDKIIAAANALSITVHDHLIIGKESEFSFREQGLL